MSNVRRLPKHQGLRNFTLKTIDGENSVKTNRSFQLKIMVLEFLWGTSLENIVERSMLAFLDSSFCSHHPWGIGLISL